jgi:tagaturonate reductase
MKSVKILQFGSGNFLRCFFDWMLQKTADATGIRYEVTLAQLTPNGPAYEIAGAREYHVLLRGYDGPEYVETLDAVSVIKNAVSPISGIDEYLRAGCEDISLIVSNSTEAGIFFDPQAKEPHNYPSRLALLLDRRAGRSLPPLMIMAMELNHRSGDLLKNTLLRYGESFGYGKKYFDYLSRCDFYNTLVDRIVPGYPRDAVGVASKIGREDKWLTSGERFHLFVIEGNRRILDEIPFDKAGLDVIVTADKLEFYHDRKVRVLNGAHTASVPVALQAGVECVDAFASTEPHASWLSGMIHEEICRAMDDSAETHAYARDVTARFRNPALGHKFRSIALNSVSKADARMTPTIADHFKKTGKVPPKMTEAAARLFELYSQGPVASLPGGPLELGDFSQLKGRSPREMAESFFPSLPEDAKEALIHAVRHAIS